MTAAHVGVSGGAGRCAIAERWQSGEARTASVFFRDSNGAPVLALTPTATVVHKDGTGGAPACAVAEVANGFYRLTFASAPTKDVLVTVDGGASLSTTRYVALEVPVGGYVDQLDTTTSSRASGAAVTALGSPAQASDLAALQAAVTALGAPASAAALAALVTTVGTPAQAASLAALVSTVGTPAQAAALAALVDTVGSPAQALALTAAVVTVLAEIDTRATPADVQVTAPVNATVEVSP